MGSGGGAFPGGSVVKNLLANAGDMGLIPGLGRSPGEGNDYPLQYSCLGNPMDSGAWRAPDSPVPSLQGPCDRSLKSEVPCGSCLNWR